MSPTNGPTNVTAMARQIASDCFRLLQIASDCFRLLHSLCCLKKNAILKRIPFHIGSTLAALQNCRIEINVLLLVGGFNPSESQLGWLFLIYGKIKVYKSHVPHHQPVYVCDSWFLCLWCICLCLSFELHVFGPSVGRAKSHQLAISPTPKKDQIGLIHVGSRWIMRQQKGKTVEHGDVESNSERLNYQILRKLDS